MPAVFQYSPSIHCMILTPVQMKKNLGYRQRGSNAANASSTKLQKHFYTSHFKEIINNQHISIKHQRTDLHESLYDT